VAHKVDLFTGSKTDGSGSRMKEVACPICTVHLQVGNPLINFAGISSNFTPNVRHNERLIVEFFQVQVPSSGSETIECGVCQHPFVVSSR